MKAILLLSGVTAVRAQSPYYMGGNGDQVPDTCYRAIEKEIKIIGDEIEQHWKNHHREECKKTENRDRVALELEMYAGEIFVLMNSDVRCGGSGGGGNCAADNFKSNSAEFILNNACDDDPATVDLSTAATVESTFAGEGQGQKLAKGINRDASVASPTLGTDGATSNGQLDETKPTREAMASDANFLAAKNDLKTYSEAATKYCFEVFRIDQNLQALLKVQENQIQDAGQGGHFFLQMNSRSKNRVDANSTRGTDLCATKTAQTDCNQLSIEQVGGMRPPFAGSGTQPTTHNYGGVPYCTWDNQQCSDRCTAPKGSGTCADLGGHCRDDGAGCKSMMYDIDLELRKCQDAYLGVEARKARLTYEESMLEKKMEVFQRTLTHWEDAQRDLRLRKDRLDGLCRKAKAARKAWAELDATAIDQTYLDNLASAASTLSTAQLELGEPEMRQAFQQSANPSKVQSSVGNAFLQTGSAKEHVVKTFRDVAEKTGIKLADKVANFLQFEKSEAPVLLSKKDGGGSEILGTIFYTIDTRLSLAQAKSSELATKRETCQKQLSDTATAADLAEGEFDEATLNVHKKRAEKEQRKVELDRATQEATAAKDAYDKAAADHAEWKTEVGVEMQEAHLQMTNMKDSNIAMFSVLDGNANVQDITKTRLKQICTNAWAALSDRYDDLVTWRGTEETRQARIVAALLQDKNEADAAKVAANAAWIAAKNALGVEAIPPQPATAAILDRNDARATWTTKREAEKEKGEECDNFLTSVDERIDAERRQISGLHELKGLLSSMLAAGSHSYRVAGGEQWQIVKAQMESAQDCLEIEERATCETHGNNACKYVEELFCYPNLPGVDGIGYFGTVVGKPYAGEAVASTGTPEYMKDLMDRYSADSVGDSSYTYPRPDPGNEEGTPARFADQLDYNKYQ